MLRLFLLALFLPFASLSQAQSLEADVSSLTFGNVDETQTDSLPLTLTNPHAFSVFISELRVYNTYGEPAFSTSIDTATLSSGQARTLQVYFHPRHNIFHNSELIICTTSPYGAIRIDLQGQGVFSNSYYQSTQNQKEEALKTALRTRLSQGYQSLGYADAREEMYGVIDNQRVNGQGETVNTLEGIYTGFTITGFNDNPNVVRTEVFNLGMNAEHTWPQSLFSQNEPMRSDLFHLFPTKVAANSARASLPFGTVSNPDWQDGGSKRGGGVFEPRDQQKGPTARAMCYFVLRYQNYSNYFNSQEAILRQWHRQFPPNGIEQTRNAAIFSVQNNRNPFIDYPQFIERITSLSSNSVETSMKTIDVIDTEIDFDTVAIGDTAIFPHIIVNTGNQPISITNESFDQPSVDLDPVLTQTGTIDPGDAAVLAVRFVPTTPGAFSATLSVDLDVPGQEQVRVPIMANVTGTVDMKAIPNAGSTWKVFPNPSSTQLTLLRAFPTKHNVIARLLDASGREVVTWTIRQGLTQWDVPVDQLPRGLYSLWLDGTSTFKVTIR